MLYASPHGIFSWDFTVFRHGTAITDIDMSWWRERMSSDRPKPAAMPCLCNALRQATRAVSRLYDEELRGVGLRTTQHSLRRLLGAAGEVRQRDVGELTSLDETTLTRNLRPLIDAGWVAIEPGEDRREKLVRLTDAGAAKLRQARPAWERAQERLRSRLDDKSWSDLLARLPHLARLAEEA
jgi:DNA-binding MarR family transcriptional regulator